MVLYRGHNIKQFPILRNCQSKNPQREHVRGGGEVPVHSLRNTIPCNMGIPEVKGRGLVEVCRQVQHHNKVVKDTEYSG